uniref:Uncharacterized protein n=1 Tax=virus sp. ctQ5V6 TaxID=2825815 RepID=A0A8S5RQJ8_9VIRU|nr:MAG TPA: hypothetical protein [virus sp. ctQ5V6]
MLRWHRRCSRSYLWNYRDRRIASDSVLKQNASYQL